MRDSDLIHGMLKLRATITKNIFTAYGGNILAGTEITIHLIGKEYSLSHCSTLYLPSVYHDEYEMVDQPEHECTDKRCGNRFTLVGKNLCPTCQSKVRKL